MKKLLRIVLLVAVMSLVGFASRSFAESAFSVTLEWVSSPDSDVAGYALYYGEAGTSLTNRIDVGLQNTAVVKGLAASVQYTFYVAAYDADQNEGGPSVPLFYTAPPISPLSLSQLSSGDMQIAFQVAPGAPCLVQYTDTLTPPNWTLLTLATGDSNGLVIINDPMAQLSRFYRAVTQ